MEYSRIRHRGAPLKNQVPCALLGLFVLLATLTACSSEAPEPVDQSVTQASEANAPPPEIQEWMDRLTVDHEYDPQTGFIVAREVIGLPEVIASGPSLEQAIQQSEQNDVLLVVFATADRCAPCQQYKKSALNDPGVIAALEREGVVVTHIEVDKEPELAQRVLGSRAIPMTYAFRSGEQRAVLRGQRSASELLSWLDEQGAQ